MAESTAREFREGDWYCESCGDHQFERNLMCRRCSAPKPMVSTNNQAAKAGDWICPNPLCKDLQFERNMFCRKCNTPKPHGTGQKGGTEIGKGGFGAATDSTTGIQYAMQKTAVGAGSGTGAVFAPDDWICPNCGDHQFAKNVACRRCGGPKPVARGNSQMPKAGDWICPNPQCQDLQFERNVACRRCGTPKPTVASTAAQAYVPPHAARGFGGGGAGAWGRGAPADMAPEDWICTSCGDHQFARNLACRRCSAPKPVTSSNNQTSKMGDWICPNPACRDVQFEKNQMCRRCGTARPFAAAQAYQMAGQAQMGYGMHWQHAGSGMSANQSRAIRPGDWTCPNPACRDIQFERNEKCRLCGTPKPAVASNKQVFKEGDWICPNASCGDVQFERNKVCRQCGTPKPGTAADGQEVRTRSRSPARNNPEGA